MKKTSRVILKKKTASVNLNKKKTTSVILKKKNDECNGKKNGECLQSWPFSAIVVYERQSINSFLKILKHYFNWP
jgi:hypothetical protein